MLSFNPYISKNGVINWLNTFSAILDSFVDYTVIEELRYKSVVKRISLSASKVLKAVFVHA